MELCLRQFVGRYTRIANLILAMCALLFCAAAIMPTQKAYAVTDGWNEYGTCEWRVDDQGCLSIRPSDNQAEGVLPNLNAAATPWVLDGYDSFITRIDIDGNIVLEPYAAISLFENLKYVETIDGISGLNCSNVQSMKAMFNGCEQLTSLDLSSFDTSNVADMSYMFEDCKQLDMLDLSSFNTLLVEDMSGMFRNCLSLNTLNLSSFETPNLLKVSGPVYAGMFAGCESLEAIDVSNLNLSKVKDISALFFNCKSLKELDLSNISTGNVTEMSSVFDGCSLLAELNLSNFETSKVHDMSQMFADCRSLAKLDLSSFDTSNAFDMSGMFYICANLEKVIIPDSFIGDRCDDVSNIFYGCNSLTTIPVNFSFGNNYPSLNKSNAFQVYPGVLETYYYGTDSNVINYDWAGDNRKLVTSQTSELTGTVAIAGDPCEGVTLKATATLDASCNDAQLRYQWFDASNDQQVSEVTDSVTFTIPEDSLEKSFYCVVTDASGKYTSSLKSNTVTANHAFGEWEVTKEATCTEDGSQTRTCEKCNYQETQAISAKGHSYSTDWSSDASGHWHACAVCGDKGDYAGHELTEWTTTKEPACTEPGEEKRSCPTCGYEETKEIAALNHEVGDEWNSDATHHWKDCIHCGESVIDDDHNYGDWTVTKQPTCTEDGEQKHSCQTCGWEETETIPATSHTPSDEWSHNATDHWHVCQDCQAEVDKAAHTFGQWITVTEPGEFTSGEKVRTCEVCGYEERAEIPGTGHVSDEQWHFDETNHWNLCTDCGNQINVEAHDFGEWTVDVPAGCTTEGTEIRTCTTCGYEQTQAISATGHTYGEWTVTTEPTCTEEGVESRTCENCGNTETRAVDELGHNFSADWSSDATGHRHECTRCDAVADEAAHTFGDWQVKQAAGCTDGIEARYCTACNYEETRTIPGAGHQPASEWSSDASGHWHACANCDDRLDLAEHTFGDWTVTADPTEETVGSKERTCEVCGYKDVVEIPALTPGDSGTGEGGDAGESSEQGSSEQENGEGAAAEEADATPQTSDPAGVAAAVVGGILILSTVTALITRRKMS